MRLAVVGSRTVTNYDAFKKELFKIIKEYKVTKLVSGGANGADALAERYSNDFDIDMEVYKAEWSLYGRSAGMIRNNKIWGNSDMGVAFWDGKSKGTAHSITLAKRQKKKIIIVLMDD